MKYIYSTSQISKAKLDIVHFLVNWFSAGLFLTIRGWKGCGYQILYDKFTPNIYKRECLPSSLLIFFLYKYFRID